MQAGLTELRSAPDPCPLCAQLGATLLHKDRQRTFFQCPYCTLIFVPRVERPNAFAEKARYDLHRNDAADPGYRRFLSRLADVVLEHVPVGAHGLDFGSGPNPVLAPMLTESGRPTAVYDVFYAADSDVWKQQYDFITACEVIEHLHDPAGELDRLYSALRPGGLLAVMTAFPPPMPDFARWHYINDFTHVCFYGPPAFAYIAQRWNAKLVRAEKDIALYQRHDHHEMSNTSVLTKQC